MPTGIYIRTEKTRLALSLARRGASPWNKGLKINRKQYPKMGHFQKHTEETKNKMVKNHKGMTGRKHTKETVAKMIMSQKGKFMPKGENSPRWKGGITPENKRIRCSIEWRIWRESVFTRDRYLCRMPGCNQSNKYLEPHHIKKFAEYKEIRFDINNGITLCQDCHNKTKHKEEIFQELFKKLSTEKQAKA